MYSNTCVGICIYVCMYEIVLNAVYPLGSNALGRIVVCTSDSSCALPSGALQALWREVEESQVPILMKVKTI